MTDKAKNEAEQTEKRGGGTDIDEYIFGDSREKIASER